MKYSDIRNKSNDELKTLADQENIQWSPQSFVDELKRRENDRQAEELKALNKQTVELTQRGIELNEETARSTLQAVEINKETANLMQEVVAANSKTANLMNEVVEINKGNAEDTKKALNYNKQAVDLSKRSLWVAIIALILSLIPQIGSIWNSIANAWHWLFG